MGDRGGGGNDAGTAPAQQPGGEGSQHGWECIGGCNGIFCGAVVVVVVVVVVVAVAGTDLSPGPSGRPSPPNPPLSPPADVGYFLSSRT